MLVQICIKMTKLWNQLKPTGSVLREKATFIWYSYDSLKLDKVLENPHEVIVSHPVMYKFSNKIR